MYRGLRNAWKLLHQDHFLRTHIISRFYFIDVHTAREAGCVECNIVCIRSLITVHQGSNFLTQHVVDFQRDISGFGNCIVNHSAWVKRIRIVLLQRELLGKRLWFTSNTSCFPCVHNTLNMSQFSSFLSLPACILSWEPA